MKQYCLKYKGELWPAYMGETKQEVKDQACSGIGAPWAELKRMGRKYSIVKVEIKEIT